jgi:hypothetical protein
VVLHVIVRSYEVSRGRGRRREAKGESGGVVLFSSYSAYEMQKQI